MAKTTTRTVTKVLAAEQDMLFGEGQIQQTRGGGNFVVDKIRGFRPVNSQAELVALDPDLFPKAVLVENGEYTHYQHNGTTYIALDNVNSTNIANYTDLVFATLKGGVGAAVDSTLVKDGNHIEVSERESGKGGGANWDVVLASSVTVDGWRIVQCVGAPTLALVLRLPNKLYADHFGWFNDGVTNTDATEIAHYCRDNNITLNFKGGTYECTGSSIKTIADRTFHWSGEGQYNTFIVKLTGSGGDAWLIDAYIEWGAANEFGDQARRSEFILEDLTLQGEQTDHLTPAANLSQGVRIDKYFQVDWRNVGLRKFYVALQTSFMLWSSFQNIKFYKYVVGWQGDGSLGGVSQNNTFDTCLWDRGFKTTDGNGFETPHSTPIIAGAVCNDNLFNQCTWESRGHLKTVDFSISNGNTFVNCRIEQLNMRTDHWLTLGNDNRIINMLITGTPGGLAYSSGVGYSPMPAAFDKGSSPFYFVVVNGDANILQFAVLEQRSNGILLTGNKNKVVVESHILIDNNMVPPSFINDEGSRNKFEFDDGTIRNALIETTPERRMNAIGQSIDLKAAGGGFSNTANLTAEPSNMDPFRLDKTFLVNTQGNHYWNIPALPIVSGNIYVFSIYIKASAAASVPMWLLENSVKLRQVGDFKVNTGWQRFSYTFNSFDGLPLWFGFSTNGVAEDIYIAYPQLEDRGFATNKPPVNPTAFLGNDSSAVRHTTQANHVFYATSAPTGGNQDAGMELVAPTPVAAGVYKRVCTVGGTPGTFVDLTLS